MALSYEDRELAFTPVYQLREIIKQKKLSPVELCDAIFRRVEEINPKLNAYLTLAQEEACKAARDAERAVSAGDDLGPLHGIPISIKDLVSTKGIKTTMGSLVYKDFIPEADSTMVRRLKEAGAIIIGKTNTPELGLADQTENKLGDACCNPWNTGRTSGGSSGGAAASVAAGISPLAQGSDGGGSVRIPASFCGLFGLKANYGRVPKEVAPWGVSHVSCMGPLTRNVRDAALMMNVMSGPDGIDFTSIRTAPPDFFKALDGRLKKLRIAWSYDLGYGMYGVKVDAEVKSAFQDAVKVFEEMGNEVEEAAPKAGEPFDLWDVLITSRYYIPYGFLLEEHAEEIMDYTRLALECGRSLSGLEVARAWAQVERLRGVMLDFFQKYDLLLTPTTAVPAFPVGQKNRGLGRGYVDWAFCPFTCVFNLSGNPAASVPCGFTTNGLPIGLQIVGRLEDEVTVLLASAAFEEARPWADKHPPVS